MSQQDPRSATRNCSGVLEGIRPKIETVPLEAAAEAYDKMMINEARFRMVLVTNPIRASNLTH
jgi:D-arabinose 1-dehydrogenase-like Zn-dependent alcohol dehydrogenase